MFWKCEAKTRLSAKMCTALVAPRPCFGRRSNDFWHRPAAERGSGPELAVRGRHTLGWPAAFQKPPMLRLHALRREANEESSPPRRALRQKVAAKDVRFCLRVRCSFEEPKTQKGLDGPVERRLRDRANQRMSSKAVGFHRVAGALAQGVGGEQDIPLDSSQPVNAHVNLKNTQHISQLEYRAKLSV